MQVTTYLASGIQTGVIPEIQQRSLCLENFAKLLSTAFRESLTSAEVSG